MSIHGEAIHLDSSQKYVCEGCGSQLQTKRIWMVDGEALSICTDPYCIMDSEEDVDPSKGVLVGVKEA